MPNRSGGGETRASFVLREHTADVAIEAEGATLGATFAAVADGLAAAQCDSIPGEGDRFAIEERAGNREALLFDLLDRLIYERDVRSVLPVDHEATVLRPADLDGREGEEWVVEASARGVSLAEVAAREVKAVTYSEMSIERSGDGWRAYVVLDV
ncbi:MAG: archease [Halobacteriales archaeon]